MLPSKFCRIFFNLEIFSKSSRTFITKSNNSESRQSFLLRVISPSLGKDFITWSDNSESRENFIT